MNKRLLIVIVTIFFSNSLFASQAMIAGGNAGDVLKSIDGGITWNKYSSGLPVQFSSITQNNNQFFAVGSMGEGVLLQSTDGIKWNVNDLPNFYPTQIISFNNQFALVDGGAVQTSVDGKTWQNHIISPPKNYPFVFLTSIAYGNNTYVAVGSAGSDAQNKETAGNCLVRSADGVNWEIVVPTVLSFHSVIFANNQFVATGKNGAIATSYDGIRWQQQRSGVGDDLGRLVFANGKYVIVGNSNPAYVLTSSDAKKWVENFINTADANLNLVEITFSNNQFIIVGSNQSGGVIYSSPDAKNWTQVFSGLKDANGNPEALWAIS